MKHIFVSIEEFLANGGVLEKDREIFNNPKGTFLGYYLGEKDDMMLGYNSTFKSFPMSPSVFYVKIEVTPIWK